MLKLLDLFCGAGGAGMGYHRAGFEVVGVDIMPQPNYPFEFHQADALAFPLAGFDAIHASPPCQAHSTLKHRTGKNYECFIDRIRARLIAWGGPYVIENVMGAPLINPVRMCGSVFPELNVRRHRLFESNVALHDLGCLHKLQPEPVDVSGTGARRLGPRTDGKGGNSRKPRNLEEARSVMGIDWMTRKELSQSIPPAFTELIGGTLLSHLELRKAS
jgi:DNA (cytosine-5)-methyltransferase 1